MEYENKEVKLCEDGKYRWVYEMNMITNPTIFLTVLKVFWGIIIGMWAVFGFFLYVIHGDWDGLLGMTRAMLVVLGIFTVLTMLGVLLLAAIYGGKYVVLFEMDENGVKHIQLPRQVKKAEALGLPNAKFVQGDAADLSRFADESFDMIVDFMILHHVEGWRRFLEEAFRVLKPGGILIAALPSEDHLFQLKSVIYDRPYRNPKPEYSPEGFELLKREEIRDRILLDSQEDIHNLFLMTPYYYKTGRADQEKLERCLQLETDIGFDVFVLRRKARP
jgi:SAM-dependent methyltransferase